MTVYDASGCWLIDSYFELGDGEEVEFFYLTLAGSANGPIISCKTALPSGEQWIDNLRFASASRAATRWEEITGGRRFGKEAFVSPVVRSAMKAWEEEHAS